MLGGTPTQQRSDLINMPRALPHPCGWRRMIKQEDSAQQSHSATKHTCSRGACHFSNCDFFLVEKNATESSILTTIDLCGFVVETNCKRIAGLNTRYNRSFRSQGGSLFETDVHYFHNDALLPFVVLYSSPNRLWGNIPFLCHNFLAFAQ